MNKTQIHYCNVFISFFSGWYVASYGPLIPFFSEETGLPQTEYSYMFFVRSIANILGGFLIKTLLRKFTVKAVIALLSSTLSLSLLASTFSLSNVNLVITLFIASINMVMLSIVIISLNFAIFDVAHSGKKVQFLGFMFGVGAMASPFFIMVFQLNTYIILAVLSLLMTPMYFRLALPQIGQEEVKALHDKRISRKTELLICGLMLIYSTEEIGMSSWIPTYSILSGVSDVQHSGLYSLLFWLFNSAFRIIWIYIPMNYDKKLKTIVISLMGVTFITVMLQWFERYDLVCIFGPIASGILISNLYTFFISLPVENGFAFTNANSANFVMSMCLGQGLLITPLGWSLSIFGYQSLMIMLFFFSVLLNYTYNSTLASMEDDTVQFQLQESLLLSQNVGSILSK